MLRYSAASARESDGAANLVVLNGQSGYVGVSDVYLRYLKDGYIRLSGSNPYESNGWKKIGEFRLEAGTYTLTGMTGQEENSTVLQLRLSSDAGLNRYIYQWDEDVRFTIDTPANAVLHIRIYPGTENVDAIARPAVYAENDGAAPQERYEQ